MKKIKQVSRCFLLALWLLSSNILSAQKLRLDSALLKGELLWPSVEGAVISADGKYATYQVSDQPRKGKITLVVTSTEGVWKKELPETDYLYTITSDSHWYIFQRGDSLIMQALGTDEQRYIPQVSSWQLLGTGSQQWLIYQVKNQEKLVIRSLPDGHEQSIEGVSKFKFNKQNTAILLIKEYKGSDSTMKRELSWIDWPDEQRKVIWEGNTVTNMVFDESGEQLAFRGETTKEGQPVSSINYYKKGMPAAVALVSRENIDSSFIITANDLLFSRDGGRLFFQLTEKHVQRPSKQGVQVDVWHYADPILPSDELQLNLSKPNSYKAVAHSYAAVATISTGKILQLQQEDEDIQFSHAGADDQALISKSKGIKRNAYWNPASRPNTYRVSTLDGSRQLIREKVNTISTDLFSFSPDGKWLLRFDQGNKCWYSYDPAGHCKNISSVIPYAVGYDSLLAKQYPKLNFTPPFETGGWSADSRLVFLYDYYDIWKVDIVGNERPVCITNGYGRKNHLKLRIAWDEDHLPIDAFGGNGTEKRIIGPADSLLLSAFNPITKENGFYRISLNGGKRPAKLYSGNCIIYTTDSQVDLFSFSVWAFLKKAQNSDTWLVCRRSPTEAPNYFITRDFINYKAISDVQPQRKYDWLTTELMTYKLPDGTNNQGILFKPENFDPHKKYAVILNYYERLSDGLNKFQDVRWLVGQDIAENIPYFTSHGYLVFQPDIHYLIGHTGQSTLDAVLSAAKCLQQLPYVDGKYMGINGHSYGGFETNYLVTHTDLFAAAAEAAGPADYISGYGSLFGRSSNKERMETHQQRLGVSLWERPDLYMENSTVFNADKVTTPFLMMHNKRDANVLFGQAVELFTALRRLGKRVWMLQYDKGGHSLNENDDVLDYTIRLTQFFDHYLKSAPCPKWMLDGIPARLKGIETGYQLDTTGREPREQPVLYKGKIQLVRDAMKNK